MPEMKMKKREKIIIVPHAPLLNGKTGHEVLDLTLSPTLSPSHTFLSHVSLSNHIKFSGSQRKVDSASESDSERSSSAAAPVDSPRRTRCFVFRRTSDFLAKGNSDAAAAAAAAPLSSERGGESGLSHVVSPVSVWCQYGLPLAASICSVHGPAATARSRAPNAIPNCFEISSYGSICSSWQGL